MERSEVTVTDQAWARGMAELVACCQDRDLPAGMQDVRARAYRQELGHLGDDVWLYAVSVRRRYTWFPSIEQLLEAAAMAPKPKPAGLLEAPRMKPDEERAAASEGLRKIQAELAAKGIHVVSRVVGEMPETDWEARRADQLAQARRLAAEENDRRLTGREEG